MKDGKTKEIFTTIDALTASLHATIDAANEVAKTLLPIWLESLEAYHATKNGPQSSDYRSLVTIKELAELWNVSEKSISDWMKEKDLPYRRVGADPRFDRNEIDEWTKRHRKNARNTAAANGKVSPLQRDCKRSGSKNNVSL